MSPPPDAPDFVLPIAPLSRPPDAVVRVPGSKSITNRLLLCASLADGASTLTGASLSEDALRMIDGLARLGVHVERDDELASLRVHGCAGHLPAGEAAIDAGDAGTAMRFLAALCCIGQGSYSLDGSPRMRERPVGDLVDALRSLGARVGYGGAEGFPPLSITARGLAGGLVDFRDTPSSQFLSAVLMVAPYAMNDVYVRVHGELPSRPYVRMTLALMRDLGVETVDDGGGAFVVPSWQRYAAGTRAVEPDASGAAYFWTAAAISGGRVGVRGLSRQSVQGDARFVDVLAQMGCTVEHAGDALVVVGPPPGELRGVRVDLNDMPDCAQTLAVAALFARGTTEILNVSNLRIKETDRLAALASELARLGARADARRDGLRIEPPQRFEKQSVVIETYSDHRMAMSFALAGLMRPGVAIRNPACVRKSFPGFFETLARLDPSHAPA